MSVRLPGSELSDPYAMLGSVETRSVSPVFVGRAGELTSLTDALARATAEGAGPDGCACGEPQALLIGGEAGVGKTRLVEEFLTVAARRGAVVAVGGCVEIGADGLPYAPFSTALRALRRALPDEMAAACAGQEGELARLLPELGEPGPDSADEHGTARLFELTGRLLERISAQRPVVLVLEDLHWSDASTRHLLTYLFRTLRSGRLVVIGTYRADDIHRRHPLRPLLAELDRLRTVRRIELARFNRAEVRRQLAGILADAPEPALVDEIFERSDGNAFFVEELACSLECGDGAGVPDSLRDLLLVRVETLTDDAQRVTRVVAEGGSAVEYELLAAVSQASPRTTSSKPCGERSAPICCSPPRRATATASGTPWSARPSATTCCRANAPGSTAVTPKRWRPTPPSSATGSAPPAWPATGTARTMPPRPCPPY